MAAGGLFISIFRYIKPDSWGPCALGPQHLSAPFPHASWPGGCCSLPVMLTHCLLHGRTLLLCVSFPFLSHTLPQPHIRPSRASSCAFTRARPSPLSVPVPESQAAPPEDTRPWPSCPSSFRGLLQENEVNNVQSLRKTSTLRERNRL